MGTVRYLCEFFFTDFWHWLGGLVFLVVIVDGIFVNLFRLIEGIFISLLSRRNKEEKE